MKSPVKAILVNNKVSAAVDFIISPIQTSDQSNRVVPSEWRIQFKFNIDGVQCKVNAIHRDEHSDKSVTWNWSICESDFLYAKDYCTIFVKMHFSIPETQELTNGSSVFTVSYKIDGPILICIIQNAHTLGSMLRNSPAYTANKSRFIKSSVGINKSFVCW